MNKVWAERRYWQRARMATRRSVPDRQDARVWVRWADFTRRGSRPLNRRDMQAWIADGKPPF